MALLAQDFQWHPLTKGQQAYKELDVVILAIKVKKIMQRHYWMAHRSCLFFRGKVKTDFASHSANDCGQRV